MGPLDSPEFRGFLRQRGYLMSEKFKTYTRSTAFSISLSQNMIELLMTCKAIKDRDAPGETRLEKSAAWHWDKSSYISTMNSLSRRGLIKKLYRKHKNGPDGMIGAGIKITEPGEKTAELLKLAGFEIPELKALMWPVHE